MQHTIKIASHQSGVSEHVIRIWERRYCALSPCRSGTNRRLYSEGEIERLRALGELTALGHRISSIAKLDKEALEQLLAQARARRDHTFTVDPSPPLQSHSDYVKACTEAAVDFDGERLRRLLHRARVQFGQRGTLLSVVTPLIHALGHGWQEGAVRTGAEHLGTAIIREYLLAPVAGSQCGENAPEIVIATPSGEVHELGAMLAASTARDLGWSVTYLGPNLPSEEIAACAKARNAKAVAVSVVYPGGSPGVTQQLSDLRRALPNQVALIIGGRVVDTYPDVLKQNHVYCISDLSGLEDLLAKLSCKAA